MIRIDQEFKALIPPLTNDELSHLEANIISDGCRDPLVVWQDVLIDGHNRHEICKRNNIQFKTQQIHFDSRNDAIIWIIRNQFGRRNLPDYERAKLALRLKPVIAEKAKEKQVQGGEEKVSQKSVKASIDTQKELAKTAGVSHDTIAKVERIERDATPELKRAITDNRISINAASQVASLPKHEQKIVVEMTPKEIVAKAKEIEKEKRDAKREQLEAKKQEIAAQVVSMAERPEATLCDAVEWLQKQPSCDLLLTDPPYMTDVEDISGFAQRWLPVALSKVKSTGRAYVFVGGYPLEIAAYLKVAIPDQILVWTYRNTIGPSPRMGYKMNWQAILYYQMPDAQPLDCPIMVEQFSVQDINAPDGRLGNRYHAWQKPDEICERFIRHSTKAGDLVLDPFVCTGSTIIAAAKLGRIGRGCDISADNLKIAEARGCKIV